MDIREYTEYKEEEILRLYSAAGWTAYTDDMQSLKQGFLNSLSVLAAYEDGELVGLIRAVGDGFTIVFVQDILVLPEKQRQGIGAALMRALLDRYSEVRQIELTTDNTPKTVAFYRSLGFSEFSETGCCGFMRCRRSTKQTPQEENT
ncbi:MAG: GNAT family N-acetyltransferase [Clostridia bacterium]|nr:GNAT family N-acetyltransferase [Clostridia bacterium]